jgi:hypothetical protein
MARKGKAEQQEIIPAEYAEFETLLKNQIDAIEKIPDTAKRLLEYKALRDDVEGAYKKSAVIDGGVEKFSKENGRKYVGRFTGYMVGGVSGVYAGAAISTLLTGGLAALAIIPGAAILAGSMYVGNRLGKRWGRATYYKLPPERLHATRMDGMIRGIDASINDLKPFFKQEENMQAQNGTPLFEELKAKFPDIKAAFNQWADKTAAYEKLRNRAQNDKGTTSSQTPFKILGIKTIS